MTHDANTFHVFRDKIMPRVQSDFADHGLCKVYYISDGSGSQYKNMYNMANLMLHEQDYGLAAEWTFTSTSHGKLDFKN